MDSGWCFAKVNNKLVEVYFEKRRGKPVFFGHCYINIADYKTKRDKKWINSDTQKYDFIYKNKEYTDRKTGEKFKLISFKNKH